MNIAIWLGMLAMAYIVLSVNQLNFMPGDVKQQRNVHLDSFMSDSRDLSAAKRTKQLQQEGKQSPTEQRTNQVEDQNAAELPSNEKSIGMNRVGEDQAAAEQQPGEKLSNQVQGALPDIAPSAQQDGNQIRTPNHINDEANSSPKPIITSNKITCEMNQPNPRPQHACFTHSDTKIPYCNFQNLKIDVSKLRKMDAGGEELNRVMGRAEDKEFPIYEKGAFTTQTPPDIPDNIDKQNFYYIDDVVKSLDVEPQQACAETIETPTLLITRYEYVNLYHTMTDWWNTFLALPDGGATDTQIIFLDAHAKGNLDPVWTTAFGPYRYVKQLPLGGVCFKNATLIPPGYSTHLWARNRRFQSPRCYEMMDAFSNFFLHKFQVDSIPMQKGKVAIIERVPYICHPRSKPKNAERLIGNLKELADAVSKIPGVTSVELVRLESMSFQEQLRLMRSTQILIGNHGAAMAHMLFMQDGSHILEFQQAASAFFTEFNSWKTSVKYHLLASVNTPKVPELVINQVVEHTTKIVNGEKGP